MGKYIIIMPVNPVFNLKGWFDENKDTLKPPVGNKLIYEDEDWIVMAVGGQIREKITIITLGDLNSFLW